jgi:group II intron reverse transcriptase/maturase
MTTKLARICEVSAANSNVVFQQLMHHFNQDALGSWYHSLDGKSASGADDVTKESYGIDLEKNLEDLHERLKRMAYRPGPVRERLIPKEGKRGATRPLGISNFEDKIVQKGVQQILEAIYEPLFLDCSFGFRPGRGCHDAIQALRTHLYSKPVTVVLDVDLANFFGTIDHELLMDIVSRKIQDQRFLRYLRRMFKAGVLSDGELTVSDEGVPQGSVCSPVLANIFAHYVLDVWFEETVKPRCRGQVSLFRYADDAVICCESFKDAERIRKALRNRLARYKLRLNEEKTRFVKFDRQNRIESSAFDFLGFTFYLGLSRRGAVLPKLKSSGKRLRVKLKRVNEWCKRNRNRYPLRILWKTFCKKLRGHVQYYGISFNGSALHYFVKKAIFTFLKWLNRRSQRKSMNYDQFKQFMQLFPPPPIRIYHRLF